MLVLVPMEESNTEHATFPRGLPRSGSAVWAQTLTKVILTLGPPDHSYKNGTMERLLTFVITGFFKCSVFLILGDLDTYTVQFSGHSTTQKTQI